MSVLPAIGALLAWGTMDFLVRVLGSRANVVQVLAIAKVTGVLSAVLLLPIFGAAPAAADIPWARLMLAAGCHLVAYYFLFKGLSRGPVAVVSPIASSYAGWTVVVAIVWMGVTPSVAQLVLTALLVAGIMLVTREPATAGAPMHGASPVVYGLLATLGLGSTLLIMEPLIDALGAYWTVLLMRVGSAVLLAPIAWRARASFQRCLSWRVSAAIGPLDVGAFLFYAAGVAAFGVLPTIPVSAAFPIVTVALATVFLRERFSSAQAVGIVCIVVCTALLATLA